MSTAATALPYSPDDLLAMEEEECYELIDGKLVEKAMSTWANYVAGNLYYLLSNFCREHQLGWVFPEGTTYQCFPSLPNMVRRADVSFICLGRFSLEQAHAEGHIGVAPDLAVEVLSPHDSAYKLGNKVQAYLKAGVKLVWVIHPEAKFVQIFRLHVPGTILGEKDELTGEEVIPGFRCPVAKLFEPPVGATSSPGNGETLPS